MISASARLRGLRAVMTREIDESFAALRVDIDRQFDELAGKYAPKVIQGLLNESTEILFARTVQQEAAEHARLMLGQHQFSSALNQDPYAMAYNQALAAQNQFGNPFDKTQASELNPEYHQPSWLQQFGYGNRP